MGRFGVELLLVAFSVLTVLGFILTYCISVELDHVTADLPYISDTGGKPPESCVFSLICNIAVLFQLLIVYLRFKIVHTFYAPQIPTIFCLPLKVINIIGFILGIASALGFLLVANFQNDNVPIVHFAGAFVVFSAGLFYQWVQTYITFRVHKSGVAADYMGAGWVVSQVIISLFSLIFFVGAILFLWIGIKNRRHRPDHDGTFHWGPSDGGFVFHVISTSCEWAASAALLTYFLTFHPDFKRVKVGVIVRRRSPQAKTRYDSIVNDETSPLAL